MFEYYLVYYIYHYIIFSKKKIIFERFNQNDIKLMINVLSSNPSITPELVENF